MSVRRGPSTPTAAPAAGGNRLDAVLRAGLNHAACKKPVALEAADTKGLLKAANLRREADVGGMLDRVFGNRAQVEPLPPVLEPAPPPETVNDMLEELRRQNRYQERMLRALRASRATLQTANEHLRRELEREQQAEDFVEQGADVYAEAEDEEEPDWLTEAQGKLEQLSDSVAAASDYVNQLLEQIDELTMRLADAEAQQSTILAALQGAEGEAGRVKQDLSSLQEKLLESEKERMAAGIEAAGMRAQKAETERLKKLTTQMGEAAVKDRQELRAAKQSLQAAKRTNDDLEERVNELEQDLQTATSNDQATGELQRELSEARDAARKCASDVDRKEKEASFLYNKLQEEEKRRTQLEALTSAALAAAQPKPDETTTPADLSSNPVKHQMILHRAIRANDVERVKRVIGYTDAVSSLPQDHEAVQATGKVGFYMYPPLAIALCATDAEGGLRNEAAVFNILDAMADAGVRLEDASFRLTLGNVYGNPKGLPVPKPPSGGQAAMKLLDVIESSTPRIIGHAIRIGIIDADYKAIAKYTYSLGANNAAPQDQTLIDVLAPLKDGSGMITALQIAWAAGAYEYYRGIVSGMKTDKPILVNSKAMFEQSPWFIWAVELARNGAVYDGDYLVNVIDTLASKKLFILGNVNLRQWSSCPIRVGTKPGPGKYGYGQQNVDDWISTVPVVQYILPKQARQFVDALNDVTSLDAPPLSATHYSTGLYIPVLESNIKYALLYTKIYMNNLYEHPLYGPIADWDVSNVTDMSEMSVSYDFNEDLSKWDVSNVTDMSGMFRGAKSFNSDLSKWDVSNVTDMSGMFRDAKSFNSDLSKWNVSNVTYFNSMFQGAESFNSDLSSWDVTKAKATGNEDALKNMFEGATSYKPERPLGSAVSID